MLGVVTEVTVKLLPLPVSKHVLLAAFDDVGTAGDAVGAIIAEGIVPAGLEMMDNPAIRAAEDFAQAGYPRDAAAILLCELDGTQEQGGDGCPVRARGAGVTRREGHFGGRCGDPGAALEGPEVRFSRDGADCSRLLLHGRGRFRVAS